ncbi:MAG: ABC transporter substrate-binding protein [Actinomycetota bacterium]
MRRMRAVLVVGATLALVGAACGKGGGGATDIGLVNHIGKGEGQLKLIAWAGYVEDGTSEGGKDFDWVHPFENQTGCQITVKYADSSDEMVSLMRQGGGKVYDGVSASGDASNRLIAGGDVAPVNIGLFPAYADVLAPLQSPPHNTVKGVHYGVPYMYGPNFLMYNTDVVKPAPTSWDVTWEPTLNGQPNPYAGKITGYDVPIFIADAAMYLKAHQPNLGITDPYELTEDQLNAAVDLLKQQKPLVSKYWSLYTDEIDGFENGDMVAGTAWPINLSLVESDGKVPVGEVVPSEGVTGWADTWMMSSHAQHPNCMLQWMKYTLEPQVQSQVALWYGAAASNPKACALLKTALGKDADLADTVRYGECGNVDFLKSIYLWKTPQADCGDGKTDCMDYSVWQDKWTEVRAG